jgi:hypothetical protein
MGDSRWAVKVLLEASGDDADAQARAERVIASDAYNIDPKAGGDRMEFVFVDWVGDDRSPAVKVWGTITAPTAASAEQAFSAMVREALGDDPASIVPAGIRLLSPS